MKSCLFVAFIAVAFAAPSFDDAFVATETELIQDTQAESLSSVVGELRDAAPELLQAHVEHIAKHAELIQSEKAKAYVHNFEASQKAIKAAIKSLNDNLREGHNHDKAALDQALANAGNVMSSTKSKAKASVDVYRNRACPTKRSEESAKAKKDDAQRKLDAEKNKKVCDIGTTWADMDIDKSTPKFGTALRNGWDAARARWLKAKGEHDAAVKAHNNAVAAHNNSMESFKTALKIQAENTVSQCNTNHKEYNILKNEVAANVRTRKATYIASLVITCYIDNVADNAAAKKCADTARTASTSIWDISAKSLSACDSTTHLKNTYGPESWQPTVSNCKK